MSLLKKTCVRQVALDKRFPHEQLAGSSGSQLIVHYIIPNPKPSTLDPNNTDTEYMNYTNGSDDNDTNIDGSDNYTNGSDDTDTEYMNYTNGELGPAASDVAAQPGPADARCGALRLASIHHNDNNNNNNDDINNDNIDNSNNDNNDNNDNDNDNDNDNHNHNHNDDNNNANIRNDNNT